MKKLLAFALVASLGIVGCNKATEPIDENSGAIAEVTLKLDGQALTRANGTPEDGVGNENTIHILEIYTFNSDGTRDANYPYFTKATDVTQSTTFLVTGGTDKKFVVAVNQYVGNGGGANYDTLLEKISLRDMDGGNSKTAPSEYGMAGEGVKTVVAGEANNLSITLQRVISKVEAPKVKDGGADVSEIAGNLIYLKEIFGESNVSALGDINNLSWDFNGYVLINGIQKTYVFEHDMNTWNLLGRQYQKTQYNGDGSVIQSVYSGSHATANNFFLPAGFADPIFVYENSPAQNPKASGEATTFVMDQVTAFLIKGTFKCDEYPAGVVRYWRVNLIKDDIWKIYRNSIYRVTMEKILTPGWDTPKKAEDDGPIVHPTESSITIDLQIAPWNVKLQNVDL